jgi:hypothetical protein
VIEADDVQPAAARISTPVDVILRIDDKPRRSIGNISRPNGLDYLHIAPEQQPTTLGRNGFPRVDDDISQDRRVHADD